MNIEGVTILQFVPRRFPNVLLMKRIGLRTLTLTALLVGGCSHSSQEAGHLWREDGPEHLRWSWTQNQDIASWHMTLEATSGGFIARQRAGVDQLANNPTWETIRQQNIERMVREAKLCPNGIEEVVRTDKVVSEVPSGTSRDLTYVGRCKTPA